MSYYKTSEGGQTETSVWNLSGVRFLYYSANIVHKHAFDIQFDWKLLRIFTIHLHTLLQYLLGKVNKQALRSTNVYQRSEGGERGASWLAWYRCLKKELRNTS